MSRLDDAKLLDLDPSGMFTRIRELGSELRRAWTLSEELELPANASDATSVIVAGMGGSATAGDYFAALCAVTSQIPVTVSRGYW
ncbi:MAG: hypothetical protein ACM3S1_04580, partial [Hyphomicrobiales bacterium]